MSTQDIEVKILKQTRKAIKYLKCGNLKPQIKYAIKNSLPKKPTKHIGAEEFKTLKKKLPEYKIEAESEDAFFISTLEAVLEYVGNNYTYIDDWVIYKNGPKKATRLCRENIKYRDFNASINSFLKTSYRDIKNHNLRSACARLISLSNYHFGSTKCDEPSIYYSPSHKFRADSYYRVHNDVAEFIESRTSLKNYGGDLNETDAGNKDKIMAHMREIVDLPTRKFSVSNIYHTGYDGYLACLIPERVSSLRITPSYSIKLCDKLFAQKIKQFCFDLLLAIGNISVAQELLLLQPEVISSSSIASSIDIALGTSDEKTIRNCLDHLYKYEPSHPSITQAELFLDRQKRLLNLQSGGINFSEFNSLTGQEFEELLISHFNSIGYKAEQTAVSGDFGADIIVITPNESRVAIQCKRFKAKVNLKAVQEVIGSMGHYACDFGIVITNSSYLNSAIKLAASNDIELWDGDALLKFLTNDISFSEISNL